MRIKKFEQLYESISQDKIKEIYDEFMGYVNAEEEGEIDFSYTNSELFGFAGKIFNKYNLTMTDVQEIVDTYPDEWNITTFFGDIIEQDKKEKEEASELDEFIRQTLGKHGVDVTDDAVNAVHEILKEYKKEHF